MRTIRMTDLQEDDNRYGEPISREDRSVGAEGPTSGIRIRRSEPELAQL